MTRRLPRSTRTDTLFPYTTLFRSQQSQPEEEGKSYAQPSCLALLMRRQLVRKNGDEDEVVYAKHDFHHHKRGQRSEEHTSELQSLMRISYAVFCLTYKPHLRTTNPHCLLISPSLNTH